MIVFKEGGLLYTLIVPESVVEVHVKFMNVKTDLVVVNFEN